ncbi:pentatricopeptide repeat-containing protein At1g74750 [Selaginella moellendorffii]|nr:pentatricopeptide repeat-containing protein At1g74750 [Selaginella moellendorffii]|eukprot:XP_024536515.1 pentatricopeptide repeat-containing protein At1g74750 [Selaginella moellendorffii]
MLRHGAGRSIAAQGWIRSRRGMCICAARGSDSRELVECVVDPSETMHPERLLLLRTRPFLYKIINVLNKPELVPSLKESLKVWEGFVDPLLVGEALKHVDRGHAALAFFNWAATQPGFKHSTYTYNCLIRCLELADCQVIVYDIFQRMLYIDLAPTSFTFDVTLRSLGRTGELDKLKVVWSEMKKLKLSPHPSTYESILHCYCKNGEVEEAYKIFSRLIQWPEPICFPHLFYNKFIGLLTQTHNVGTAYLVFLEMIESGYEGNVDTIGKLVIALHKAGRHLSACKVFDERARMFQTALTGRLGVPGDSIADHYLYHAEKTKRLWRAAVLSTDPRKKRRYGGPTCLKRHGY